MTSEDGMMILNIVAGLEEGGVLGWGSSYDPKRNFSKYNYVHMRNYHIMLNNNSVDGTVVHVTRHSKDLYRVERFLDDKGSKRLLCLVNKKQLAELRELAKEREVIFYDKEKEYIYTLKAE